MASFVKCHSPNTNLISSISWSIFLYLTRLKQRPKSGRRLKVFSALRLLVSIVHFLIYLTAVHAFVVLNHQPKSDTEYIYSYDVHLEFRSGGADFGGHEKISDLKISSILTVSPMWSSKSCVLGRFSVTKSKIKFSQNGQTSSANVDDLLKLLPQWDFYVEFEKCRPVRIFARDDGQELTTDFERGIASLFQYKPTSWKGTEVDIDGNCTVHYNVDHRGVHKVKSGCKEPEDSGFQGTSTIKTHRGFYHLQVTDSGFLCEDMKEVIEKLEMTQQVHQYVNMVPKVGSVVTTTQNLILKEQLDFNGKLGDAKDINEAVNVLKKKFKVDERSLKSRSTHPYEHRELNVNQMNVLFKKHKKNLKPEALATVESAQSFKKLVKAISRTKKLTKDHFREILRENIKEHGLEIMDIYGSSRNINAHMVAMETLGSPTQTDMSERYLWALSQLRDSPAEVAEDLLILAEGNIKNGKLKETLMLTIGSVARRTSAKTSSKILQWLVVRLTECKNEECVILFVKAMRNTQSYNMASVLLELVKADDNKAISIQAMKALFSLPIRESEKAVGKNKFYHEMVHLFKNKNKDSSIRGMAAEILANGRGAVEDVELILTKLKKEKKEFKTFVLKRLLDLAKYNSRLHKVIKKMVLMQILNWDLLATGGMSESFSRILAVSDAGNFSFSFDLEIAGIMLKRSTTEFFLSSPTFCEKTSCEKFALYQLDTFGGGMQQYLGTEGLDEDEIDKSDPNAGMQITVNDNLLRPFIFFTSSSELMSLYWSGAAEKKTSAFQANMVLQDTEHVFLTSSGLPVRFRSSGAMSFDSSGKASISLWSKAAETKVENSGAYHLYYRCTLLAPLKLKHAEVFQGKGVLEVTTDVNWSNDNQMCIKVQMPQSQSTYKRIQAGKPTHLRVVKHQGKTVFLTNTINRLCSQMKSP